MTTSSTIPDRTATTTRITAWHMTLGAQVEPGGVRFRVWAPKRARVDVVLEDERT